MHAYNDSGNRNFHDNPITHDFSLSTKTNFPVKCFYSPKFNEIYCFYRQGYAFTIKKEDLSDYRFEDIYDLELG